MHLQKKIILVDLLGGFGNQLFQILFAKKLSTNNKVYINDEEYKKKVSNLTKRKIEIPPEIFELKTASSLLVFFFKIIKKFNFYSWVNDDIKNLTNTKFIRFTGYWQNYEIIKENKNYLIDIFSKIEPTLLQSLESKKVGSTLIHVRRSDYLGIKEELALEYYSSALKYCKNNILDFNYSVFTDDINFVLENPNVFSNYKSLYTDEKSTLEIFFKMFEFENYVIANSTFSLIPAILNESKKTKVIYPKPWFKNNMYNFNFPNNWISITNL